MTRPQHPPVSLAAALKAKAMALDAEVIRRLRRARRMSDRLLHDVRVSAKTQRAWWQLARAVAGKSAAVRADRRLRDVARLTAPLRETHVMRRVLTRLAGPGVPARIRAALESAARQIVIAPPAAESTDAFVELRDALVRAFRSDVAAWRRLPVPAEADDVIVSAAIRSYRKARRRGRRAAHKGRPRDLHVWRKWAKANQAQLEFLRSERPDRVGADPDAYARLARQLGRVQDLAVLKSWFAWRESTGAIGAEEAKRLRAFFDARQKQLRARSERLGRRLFALKPGAYADALRPAAGPRALRARPRRARQTKA